ncbi:ComF family protein [Streptomyces sp. NPDC001315]|uniref:ComF family protein n=1 Tax=Streptomyces sp. NPDC001315 TaxID=3364562 RepID=UPI00367CC736
MRGWWQDLTDLVLPAECGGCGRPRTVLCAECRAALSGAAPSRVRPVPEPPGLPLVHAAARYADEARAVLLAHKERGALALTGPIGTALAGAVRSGLREAGTRLHGAVADMGGGWEANGADREVLLVPVPSGRRAVRARGHDPARRIALAAAGELRRTGTPARVLAVLRQRRAVADQAGLNSRQRLDNLAGALAVVSGAGRLLGGGPVVLVDDLMTTGASLAEAARAVRAATAQAAARGRPPAAVVRGVRGATPVYSRASREGREERTGRAAEGRPDLGRTEQGTAHANGVHGLICAAVVAAPPDSFELNRN